MATQVVKKATLPSGPAAAALLASAIGCAVIGLMTTGAELIPALKSALNWYNPAGPLSGKTGVGIILWLITWAILHNQWKTKNIDVGRIFTWSLIILFVGLLLTFPPIFEAFAH